jgi:zinc protease
LAAAIAMPALAAAQEKYGISSTTLENGLEVIVVENHALPLVTVEIAVKNGAYTEPPEFDGLSHLYEHMFFKANAAIPNQERYMERARELGATWNGTTSEEMVNYYMTVHKKHAREAAVFMRDALLYPLFMEEELRREWPVVLGEFDRNEANPGFHLYREVGRRLWFEHFSRKNAIGDREVIFNATREQMREIQRRYYVPNNSALIVGGDVRPDEIFEMAADLFGDWERGPDPHARWPEPAHPPLPETRRIVVAAPIQTAAIELAWHGPSMRDDKAATFAADVFSFILGQPDSNFQKALVDSGLVDGVGISYYSLVHTGPIALTAVTSPERLDAAWGGIVAEIEKFDDPAYVTDEQIEAAKNQLEIQGIYERQQTSEFCHTLAFWWCTGGLDYYLNYVESLRAVTREDLARYVRTYIEDKPRVEAAMLDEARAANLEFAKTAETVKPQSGTSAEAVERAGSAEGVTTEEFDVDELTVVLRRNPLSEIVVASLVVQGGLPAYGAENAGRELLLLELLDKGSARHSKEEVNRQLARTGAAMGADARHDYSTFALTTLRRDLAANFPIFADAVARPKLDETEVALALERRLTSIRAMEENPDAYISILGSRNFYRDHPYATPPSGTEEAVRGMNAERLRELHGRTMTRSRLKLFIVGDVDRETATALVEAGLGDLPAGDFDRPIVMREPTERPTLLAEDRDLPTNYLWGSFAAPNMGDADFAPLQVAVSILSDRLFEEVRTKRNLSYAVDSQLSSRRSNYGLLYVTAVKPNETGRVMLDQVERIRTELVSEKDLGDKIEEMIVQTLMENQSVAGQAGRLILYDANGGGWAAEAGSIEALRGVTPTRVREAAAKWLRGFHFAALGDPEALDRELFTSRQE